MVRSAQPKLTQIHIESMAMGTLTIENLLQSGIVEYVDVNEENNCLIAVTEKEVSESEGSEKHNFLHSRSKLTFYLLL